MRRRDFLPALAASAAFAQAPAPVKPHKGRLKNGIFLKLSRSKQE